MLDHWESDIDDDLDPAPEINTQSLENTEPFVLEGDDQIEMNGAGFNDHLYDLSRRIDALQREIQRQTAISEIFQTTQPPELALQALTRLQAGRVHFDEIMNQLVYYLGDIPDETLLRILGIYFQMDRTHLHEGGDGRISSMISKRLSPQQLMQAWSKGALHRFVAFATSKRISPNTSEFVSQRKQLPFLCSNIQREPSNNRRKKYEDELKNSCYAFLTAEEHLLHPPTDLRLPLEAMASPQVRRHNRRAEHMARYVRGAEFMDSGWLYKYGLESGIRVYMNARVGHGPDLFREVDRAARKLRIQFDFKTPIKGDRSLGYTDDLVLYPTLDQRDEIRELILMIAKTQGDRLGFETPKFAIPFRMGEDMRIIPGVAISSDPSFYDESPLGTDKMHYHSLNSLLSKILALLMIEAHSQDMWLDDPNFDTEGVFDRLCTEHRLNPYIPALNNDDNPEDFYEFATGL
jgi:hypothetical protein